MFWLFINGVIEVETPADGFDQFVEADTLLIPQVENFESGAPIECQKSSIDDIVDVGVISLGRTVAVHRYWLPLLDQRAEAVNCHAGSLPRAVDGEVAQTGDVDPE